MSLSKNTIDHIGTVFLRAIINRMKEMGLNQSALAKRMNVSRAYVSRVLKGDVNISFVTAVRFAHALQMDFIPVLTPHKEEVSSAPAMVNSSLLQT